MLTATPAVAETAKNGCQILAFAVAGIWAMISFNLTKCPYRAATFDATTTLTWQNGPTPTTCFADWNVAVKNVSARSVEVRHVTVRVWEFSAPRPAGRAPAYVNLDTLRPRKDDAYLFRIDLDRPSDPFITRYSPTATADHTFEWVFDKHHATEWIVLEIDLFEDKEQKRRIRHVFEWSAPCAVVDTDSASPPHVD
jgi:hypothetical protein